MVYCWLTKVWSDWKWKNLHYATPGLKWFKCWWMQICLRVSYMNISITVWEMFDCLNSTVGQSLAKFTLTLQDAGFYLQKNMSRNNFSHIVPLTSPFSWHPWLPQISPCHAEVPSTNKQQTTFSRVSVGKLWLSLRQKRENRWNRERTGRFWQIQQLCKYEPLWQIVRFAITGPA